MKFTLQEIKKVPGIDREEDEYHYMSEDGEHTCSFHAGQRPWTFVISGGNLSLIQADELVNEWCTQGMNDSKGLNQDFTDRVRELNINL